VRIKSLANSSVEGKEMKGALVPGGELRIEGGEEAKSYCGYTSKGGTVGETRYGASCRIDLKGILGSGKL
jgi:hypothetical protein